MTTFELLDGMSPTEVRELLSSARRRRFRAGEVVFHDGDPGESLFLVDSGHIAIRVITPLGDIATVRILRPGQHFGELAVLRPGPRAGGAVAVDAAELLALHVSTIQTMRDRVPVLTDALLLGLVAEVRRVSASLVEALYLPVDARVYRRLLDVHLAFGGVEGAELPVTQELIAQLAGTTRPSANRVLKQAEAAGVIEMRRARITICDVDALRRRAR